MRCASWGIGSFNANSDSDGGSSSLAVLSLSSDPGAMAVGPQLAVFAASLGISTTLVIGTQQDTDATATLRTACDVPPPASSKRSSYLRVAVSDGGPATRLPGAALTIVVAVVDAQTPKVADTMHATTTVLGVSAGATTAGQLARAASSAAADGREIDGILVADPEPTDHTTGRNPEAAWADATQGPRASERFDHGDKTVNDRACALTWPDAVVMVLGAADSARVRWQAMRTGSQESSAKA